MEDRWFDVDFDKFMAKLPGGDFHPEEHVEDMILDIEPFDVKGTQTKDEKATYPILVSVSSLSPLVLANAGCSLRLILSTKHLVVKIPLWFARTSPTGQTPLSQTTVAGT